MTNQKIKNVNQETFRELISKYSEMYDRNQEEFWVMRAHYIYKKETNFELDISFLMSGLLTTVSNLAGWFVTATILAFGWSVNVSKDYKMINEAYKLIMDNSVRIAFSILIMVGILTLIGWGLYKRAPQRKYEKEIGPHLVAFDQVLELKKVQKKNTEEVVKKDEQISHETTLTSEHSKGAS
ncbi:hypothetical protein [Brevibacillus sp. BC25]|uniref:hypothetical protein n=1 Tax=unclassified Brevibacillus TaxID=2684853 RepID=UPI0002710BDB|nr:hypothetical protein [Brevibacillus sp. BC25]EJL22302.1 hypothetical protein PMI05_05086 [Brevibacillus sp. BC25]